MVSNMGFWEEELWRWGNLGLSEEERCKWFDRFKEAEDVLDIHKVIKGKENEIIWMKDVIR